jgi:thiamine-phosphate pyrophosphorylase
MDGTARRERLARSRLYLVLEARPHGRDPRPLLDAALRGGVDVVQLRERTLPDEVLVAASEPFRAACEEHRALFVLNDRPDLVEACGADGVHVGRDDAPVAEARALVGSGRLIGLSASTIGELEDVAGADYVGVTAFATPTKDDAVAGGLNLVRAAAQTLRIPWFAIGGVDATNAAEMAAAGAPGVAVVRAIRDAADPEAAAQELRAALDGKQ